MFSTHYHELTKMSDYTEGIKNVHVTIKESDGEVSFLHKVKDGAVDRSYGINVAKLANLPEEVIDEANNMLLTFETSSVEKTHTMQMELDLDNPHNDELREFIKRINPYEVTPIEAIKLLDDIKKLSNK